MHKKIRLGKNRILVYYLLAIVLPSLVLGALAFRGVINDQAINERDNRQQLIEASESIIAESDRIIAETEKQFLQYTSITDFPSPFSGFFEDSIMSVFLKKDSLVNGIFYKLPSGQVKMLKTGLLFFPDGTFNQFNSTAELDLNNYFLQGWQYEFQNKNYQRALNYYQNQLKTAKDDAMIVSLLIPIARIQKKLFDYKEAINTYKLIEQRFGKERINRGLPLGVVALMEKGNLYLTIGDTLNALKATIKLIYGITESYWDLEISQYKQLISASKEIVQNSELSKNGLCQEQIIQIETLLEELTIHSVNTSQQLEFLDNTIRVLEGSGFKSPGGESEHRIYMNLEQDAILISVFPSSGEGQWGLIYKLPQFLNQLTQSIIPGEQQKIDFQWQLLKEGRELLSQSSGNPSEEIKITAVFPSYLPSWSLVLSKEPTGMITTFLKASKGIFIYIFLFIMIVLVLGLFFTLQIINRELLLSKMKSDFISTVSHEFKSPLTSIRQMSEMLYNERIKSEVRKKEYFAVMLEQSERLSHLIDNILDFSKIEEGKKDFRFEKVDMVDLISRVILVFQNSIGNEGFEVISVIPETLPEAFIDTEAIQQVLYNLLDNAYKYSGSSKKIEITVKSVKDSVNISIRDLGIGIARADQQKIFDRFYRGGNELTRFVKGSGIGLTIVKKIIDAHNGTIALDSTPGEGSTFKISLPIETKTKL